MIELIRKKCKQGDIVKITLDGGREITGALDEISAEHLTLMVDKNPVVLTHKIIVLFEIVKKLEISQPAINLVPDQTQVKPVKPENTPTDEADKQVSDSPTSLIQPTLKVQKDTQEFAIDLITNYNDALSYCSYLDEFDISNKVASLDFKYGNPTETKNNIDKKLMRLSAMYDDFKKNHDLESVQPAIAEINSLFADNPGNTNLAWNYFILSCINRDLDSAFNCLHTYSLRSASTDLKSWQDYYIYLIGHTRLYDKLEELIRRCKSIVKENTRLVEFSRKASIYMLYKSKMNTAIESALGIEDNNLLKTMVELIDKVPRRSIYLSATSSPRQTQQLKPSKPKTQIRQGISILDEINIAVTNNDINAIDLIYDRYKSSDDATKFTQIGTAYQRLGDYKKAVVVFNHGLLNFPSKEIGFITSRVQVYELLENWEEADKDYTRLLNLNADSLSKKKHYTLAKARVLVKAANIDKARTLLHNLAKEFPYDTIIASAIASIDNPLDHETSENKTSLDDFLAVDTKEDQVEVISPMLKFDIEDFSYRDKKILKQGLVTEQDAIRLKNKAVSETSKTGEMAERYPLFLEAAKAYNDIDPSLFDSNELYMLLARYSALRAGSLFLEIKKMLSSSDPQEVDISTIQRLSDSASSYYLESSILQLAVQPDFMIMPITNYFKLQFAIQYFKSYKHVPLELFKGNFKQAFRKCINTNNEEIKEVAYKAIVVIGSTNMNLWNELSRMENGLGLLKDYFTSTDKKTEAYKLLGKQVGKEIGITTRPGEALKVVFLARKEQVRSLTVLLTSPKLSMLTSPNIRHIEKILSEVDDLKDLLLDTDMIILNRLHNAINIFKPYETRTANERVSIIVRVRSEIFGLIEFIENNPTYMGRVAFFPILQSWKKSILKLEAERLQSVIPRLSISVDPQTYHKGDCLVFINVVIQNIGEATTDNYSIKLELLDKENGEVYHEDEVVYHNELHVEENQYHRLQSKISQNHKGSLFLRVHPRFSYQGTEIQQDAYEFTISPEDSFDLKVEDIKWNYLNIPDKHMFKGREKDLTKISNHIQSPERSLSYILYGLTRTGKTSILKYLKSELYALSITSSGRQCVLCPIRWDFDQAAAQSNAKDLWTYFINTTLLEDINLLRDSKVLYSTLPQINRIDHPRFKDLGAIISMVHSRDFYPVFLIDEFSHVITMIKKGLVDSSFLAQLRSYALEGKASFIFAGTYDINNLVTDPDFGITGQFANVIKMKVSKINNRAAADLIHAMGDKLHFTELAVKHILELSFCIPYFIQIICYHCAKYALENKITYIGYPEVEEVVKILSGENDNDPDSLIQRLEAERFSNNLLSSADPPETGALLATIAHSNFLFTPYHEIIRIWGEHRIKEFQAVVAQTLDTLVDKEILLRKEEEGEFYFKISVGLFERWLRKEIPNLNYALDKLHKINE